MSEAASPTGLSRTSMVVPIANVSSLSQAWIDALGLARHQAVPARTPTANAAGSSRERACAPLPSHRVAAGAAEHLRPAAASQRARMVAGSPAASRNRIADIERMRVRKKVASIHPPQPDVFRRSAGRVTIISRRGTIRLLLQRDAGTLRITAVCDPRLVSTITDALRATHVAYAARGVSLYTNTYPEKSS